MKVKGCSGKVLSISKTPSFGGKESYQYNVRWFDDEVIPLYNELELFEKAENAEKIKNIIKKT